MGYRTKRIFKTNYAHYQIVNKKKIIDLNPIRSHFFCQPEADPDCDFMSNIFLRATDAFVRLCFWSN